MASFVPQHLVRDVWVWQSPTFATNSGLVVAGAHAVLIDPGMAPQEIDAWARFVEERGATVRFVLITHAHWDHMLGAEHFPSSTILTHRSYPRVVGAHAHDLARQVAHWKVEEGLERHGPFRPPAPSLTFDSRVTVRLGSRDLTALHAPGHSPDQIAIFVPDAGLLWAGDMLSDREPPMAMDSIPRYLRTLSRLQTLPVKTLVPGHGAPASDAGTIRFRFEQDIHYLESLQRCVIHHVESGASLEETVAGCTDVSFVQPDSYPHAHVWNIEQAYVASGGSAVADYIGWEKDWL